MGVEGGITVGQNFAFQFRNGFGASISPDYIYVLEGGLNSRDVGHGSIAEKSGTDFGVSYIAGVYFESVTDGNQTQYSVGGGALGCWGTSYTWDNQGNHSLYVGIDVSGKIAACFGAEAEFKAGFFSNGKNYLS